MQYEYAVWNSLTKKYHRLGMTEKQVDSLLKVHLDDAETDKKKPFLVKHRRTISDWEPV